MEDREVHSGDHDYQRYCQLLELWSRENTIKTQKLQYFLLTNAVLIIGVGSVPQGADGAAMVCLVGAVLSLVWLMSIGRTTLFQKRWQALIAELSNQNESDCRFQILSTASANQNISIIARIAGAVSSKYYLIGAPALGIVFWLWRYLRLAQ